MKFGLSDTAEVMLINKNTGEMIIQTNSLVTDRSLNSSMKDCKYKVEITTQDGEVFEYGTNTAEFTNDGNKLITDRFEFVLDSKTTQIHEGFALTHQTKGNVDE